jgi:histidinol phosphatase-like enzyme
MLKKRNIAITLFSVAALWSMSFKPDNSGGKVGYSSAPTEGNCTGCHAGTVNSGSGSATITTTVPASGYVAGSVYQVSMTVAQAQVPLFGFDLTALNSGGTNAGTMTVTNTAEMQILASGGRNNMTHKSAGGSSTTGSKTFTFNWTAPATSTGVVTFYASGLAANGTGSTAGDFVYTTNKTVSPAAAPPVVTITGTTNLCANTAPNGACTALTAAASPTATYTYAWSNQSTGATIQVCPTLTTSYTVTASSTGAGTATASVTVTVNPRPVPTTTGSSAVCLGSSAQIGVGSATGATFTAYQWSTNATTQIITVTPTATTTYTATVTNAAGCTATATRTVTVNPRPTPTITGSDVVCVGQGGQLSVAPANGGTFTSYQWSNQANTQVISVMPTATTTYTVTVTDANGCTASTTRTITVNPLPLVAVTQSGSLCNGAVALTASGGATYTWSIAGASGATASAVAAGVYTVTATSTLGCAATASVVVAACQPSGIVFTGNTVVCPDTCTTITASVPNNTSLLTYTWSNNLGTGATKTICLPVPPTTTVYSVTATNASGTVVALGSVTITPAQVTPATITGTTSVCLGSTATLSANPSTAGFTYLWNNGVTTRNLSVIPTTNTIYTCVVTNTSGCKSTASAAVTINALPAFTISESGSLCSPNGLTLTATAGAGTLNTYAWSNQATGNMITVNVAGVYTVTATNSAGCASTRTVTVTQPTPPTASIAQSGTLCTPNGVLLTATTNSTTNNTFIWNNQITTATNNVQAAGIYTVTVTNSAGCTASATVAVAACATITVGIGGTNVVCGAVPGTTTGGCTMISASGSSSNPSNTYTYVWSNQATTAAFNACPTVTTTYTVTATANTGATATASYLVTVNPAPIVNITQSVPLCGNNATVLTATGGSTYSWGAISGSASLTVTSAGTYTVTVTSAAGCTATKSIVVSLQTVPTLAITQNGTLCTPNGVAMTASTGFITYVWSNNSTFATANTQTAGVYTVTATTQGGCTRSATTAVAACAGITVAISGNTNVCAAPAGTTGGCTTLIAAATGSTGATYTYAWSNQTTTATLNACPTVTTTYTVTATASTGATATALVTVTVNPAPVVNITQSVPLCGNNATVLTATGGGTYSWGAISGSASLTVTAAGTYTVTVTSVAGCTATKSVVVTLQIVPALAITQSGTLCSPNGVAMTASTGFMTYAWSNNTTSATVNTTVAGVYTVTATTQSGCTRSASTTVAVCTPTITVAITGATNLCTGSCTTLAATATGSTTGYTYNWSVAGTTTPTITVCPTVTTTYTVSVSSGGSVATSSITVIVNSAPSIVISGNTSFCTGGFTRLIPSLAGGAAGTFVWSNNLGTGVANIQTVGVYTITATSAAGCTATSTVAVTMLTRPTASITQPTISCVGTVTSLTASGGGTYLWNTQATTASITVPASSATPLLYTVTVTSANGCTATATKLPQYFSGPSCTGTGGGGGTARTIGSTIENIGLYPNPTESNFSLVFGENEWLDATINVTDVAGKSITTITKSFIAPSETISFETINWQAGVYFVTIENKTKRQVLKVGKM